VADDGTAGRVRGAFDKNFARGVESGAAVSVWREGHEIVNFHAGWRDGACRMPWDERTLVLIWSATKGLASACVLHAMQEADLHLETRVAHFWPAFGRSGKEAVTLGQVLSHRAGLGALDATDLSLLDHESVARAIERQRPLWDEEQGHGYGPRTFGFIADEIVRKLAGGAALGEYFRRVFGDSMVLDMWIGLPEAEHARVAQMLAPRAGCSDFDGPFAEAMAEGDSLTRRAFAAPGGLAGASAMNSPVARSASIPSLGGIGSASSLAKFYAMLAEGGVWDDRRYFSEASMKWMTTRLAQGLDQVLLTETAFSAGFMMDPVDGNGRKERTMMGPSLSAFGHPGAGGSLAFADPENRVSFAYVMNQMESWVLPGKRATTLVEAVYGD
jgi:CubicO group peptidase (beta-lactamase class C family)